MKDKLVKYQALMSILFLHRLGIVLNVMNNLSKWQKSFMTYLIFTVHNLEIKEP